MKQSERNNNNSTPLDKIDDGHDSVIFGGQHYFYKEYYAHITKEVLEDYHKIHEYLSQFEREVPLFMPMKYDGETVIKIIFDIVNNGKNPTTEAYNIITREKIHVSHPPYIPGTNLGLQRANTTIDYRDDGNVMSTIQRNIANTLSCHFPYIDLGALSMSNIMTRKVENSTLYCTITDLGDQIIPFVENQKDLGIFDKIVAKNIKKRYGDKVIVRYKDSGEMVGQEISPLDTL